MASRNDGQLESRFLGYQEPEQSPLHEYPQPRTKSLHMGTGGNNMPLIAEPKALVRRLTPIECERLQGFPDEWTAGQSDSQRYKQMGNAVAVPVVEWIIQNICDTI